jgi:sigma-B regulation protein RsbQ
MDVGARHAMEIRGEGPNTLVLVHGLGCDQRIWSALAPRLAVDHRVVTFDLAGMGRASSAYDPRRHANLRAFAEDVVEVVRSLGGPPPVVIGHSLGANLVVQAAVAAPTFASRLVLLMLSPRFLDDPPYRGGFTELDLRELLDTMDRNFNGWARSFSSFVAPQPEVAATMDRAIVDTDPARTQHLTELVFRSDLRAELPRVRIPTLSVQTRNDPVIPSEAGALVARSIPGAREHVLAVPGHCPHLSHPAAVEQSIRAYLGDDA